jgi:predicted ester cyclase
LSAASAEYRRGPPGARHRTVVESNTLACQTWIEGTFVRAFTLSPVGSLPPNGRRVVWDPSNIHTFDNESRITAEWVRTDNQPVRQQPQATG